MERVDVDDANVFYSPRTRDQVERGRRERRRETRVTCAIPVELWLHARKNHHELDGRGIIRSLSRTGAQIAFTEWSKRWAPRAGHALALALSDGDESPITLDCVVEWRSTPRSVDARIGVRFVRVPSAQRARIKATIRRLSGAV